MSDETRISLATLPSATKQQVFDQVARHLLTQYRKATRGDDDSCAYRGDYGLRCAVGCLISDNEYSPEMEGKTWSGLCRLDLVKGSQNDGLIDTLQIIHDNYSPNSWRDRLHDIALDYGLSNVAIDGESHE